MNIIVDGLAVNYELKGKGKSILLLHGWADNLRTFSVLAGELIKTNQVVALDLPGFGGSQAPNEVWDLDNYAQFVADFLAKINIKPMAIIGHSNGGALAIRGLATGKLKTDKLVLLASSGVRDSNNARRLVLKVIAKTGKALTFWLPAEQKQQLRRRLYGTIGSDLLVAPHLQETFKRSVRQDVQADAAKLTLPTLLVYAERDPAVPIADGERFHQLIKGSKLEVLNSSDHFIHHDQPAQVLQSIKEFI